MSYLPFSVTYELFDLGHIIYVQRPDVRLKRDIVCKVRGVLPDKLSAK